MKDLELYVNLRIKRIKETSSEKVNYDLNTLLLEVIKDYISNLIVGVDSFVDDLEIMFDLVDEVYEECNREDFYRELVSFIVDFINFNTDVMFFWINQAEGIDFDTLEESGMVFMKTASGVSMKEIAIELFNYLSIRNSNLELVKKENRQRK